MAPLGRGRRSGTTTTLNNGPIPLPPYQPLANPLTPDLQRALNELPRTHRLDGLKKHLAQATQSLTTVAGDVNDRYYKKLEAHRKHKARRQGKDEEEDEASEHALEEMRVMVDEMTSSLEQSLRKAIDAKVALDGVEVALREISANISSGAGAVVPTQSTLGASQFRQRKRQRDADSEGEDSNDQEDANSAHPLGLIKRKMMEYNSNYQNLSMRDKYASNNDYIGFKKIVHDSRHPEEDARPMPHASTWFPDSPSKGDNAHGQPAGNMDDDDDDLEVASERISLKCPVTLLPMRQPVSSRKCPHSFEQAAILELLAVSRERAPGDGRGKMQNAMKCPVCEVMLTASDLYTDPFLVRKIARIQAAADDSESEVDVTPPPGTQRRLPQRIDSDNEIDGGAARRSTQIKGERLASSAVAMVGGRRDREISMVPATQLEAREGMPTSTAETDIVDLEDEEDEEEEEEEEGGGSYEEYDE